MLFDVEQGLEGVVGGTSPQEVPPARSPINNNLSTHILHRNDKGHKKHPKITCKLLLMVESDFSAQLVLCAAYGALVRFVRGK